MDIDTMRRSAYEASGCIRSTGGSVSCSVCGASAPSYGMLVHRDGCLLKEAVESAGSVFEESSTGASGIPQDTVLEIMSKVSMEQTASVDAFMDSFSACPSSEGRAALVHGLRASLPGLVPEMLVPYVMEGVRTPERRAAMRLYLLFETGAAAEEAALMQGLEELQREFDGAGEALGRLAAQGLPAGLDSTGFKHTDSTI